MRRSRTPLAGVGVPILTALLLGACTATAQPTPPPTPSAATATATGAGTPTPTMTPVERPPLVVETLFDFTSLDPSTLVERSGRFVADAVYETLTMLDPDDPTTVRPGLAEWTTSPERTWLTLRLRPNVTFSDGSHITSDDVIYTLSRARGLGGAAAQLLGPISLTKVDNRTLTVTSPDTNFALPALLANPAFGILNADVVKANGGSIKPGDAATTWLTSNSAGSGPYVIDGVEPGRSITLKPNPNWAGDRPEFSDVIIRNATPARQAQDIESGAADIVLDLPPDRADAMQLRPAVSSVAITSQTSPAIAFLLLNDDQTVNTWTGNADFIRAVRLGLDVQAITEAAGAGATPALGLVPRGLPAAFEPAGSPADLVAGANHDDLAADARRHAAAYDARHPDDDALNHSCAHRHSGTHSDCDTDHSSGPRHRRRESSAGPLWLPGRPHPPVLRERPPGAGHRPRRRRQGDPHSSWRRSVCASPSPRPPWRRPSPTMRRARTPWACGAGRPSTSMPRPPSRSHRAASWRIGPAGCAA